MRPVARVVSLGCLVVGGLGTLGVSLLLFSMASHGLFASPDPTAEYGARVEPVGDVDGDGVEDVLRVRYQVDGSWYWLGDYLPNWRHAGSTIEIYSGRTGARLRRGPGALG